MMCTRLVGTKVARRRRSTPRLARGAIAQGRVRGRGGAAQVRHLRGDGARMLRRRRRRHDPRRAVGDDPRGAAERFLRYGFTARRRLVLRAGSVPSADVYAVRHRCVFCYGTASAGDPSAPSAARLRLSFDAPPLAALNGEHSLGFRIREAFLRPLALLGIIW